MPLRLTSLLESCYDQLHIFSLHEQIQIVVFRIAWPNLQWGEARALQPRLVTVVFGQWLRYWEQVVLSSLVRHLRGLSSMLALFQVVAE